MPTLFDRVLLTGVSVLTVPALVLGFMWLYVRNPVFAKDVQTRMRGARAYVILGVYLAALSLVLAIGYLIESEAAFSQGRMLSPTTGARVGRAFYWALLSTQGAIIILFTPAFTAGAITLEREQQTLEMLIITRLRPEQIVWGRLWSAVFFPFLLLLTSVPLVSVTFLLGGVAPEEVVYAYLSQALCALVIGALGILSSVVAEKTALSTVVAFGLMMGYVAITTAAATATSGISAAFATGGSPFAGMNPFYAIGYASGEAGFFGASVPSWLISGAISILLALAVGAAAVRHLSSRYYQQRRGMWSPKALLTVLVFLTCFVLMGWFAAQQGPSRSPAGFAESLRLSLFTFLAACLAAVIVLAPSMCSSEGLEVAWPIHAALVRRLFHPRTWLGGDGMNSLPYFVGWVVTAVLMGLLGLAFAGGSPTQARWQNVLAMFVIFGLAVLCYCSLAVALSGLLRRRWAAAATAYAVIVVALLVPVAAMAAAGGPFSAWPSGHPIYPWSINLLYLNPFAAMAEVTHPGNVGLEFGDSLLLEGAVPFYLVHAIAMAAFTTLFAFVAAVTARLRRQASDASLEQPPIGPPRLVAAAEPQSGDPTSPAVGVSAVTPETAEAEPSS